MAAKEIVPELSLVPSAAPTPGELVRIAVSQNADIDKLAKLLDLQERWEKNEAKKAFDVAKAQFGTFDIQILKDRTNPQYNSRYPSIGNLVNTVTPFLAKCGLTPSWELDQSNGIKVTCILSHVGGHEKRVSLTVPPDKSGSKNELQQIKSAITYARAVTFESVCGVAATDSANANDDGNGTAARFPDLDERLEWIANSRNFEELDKLFKQAYRDASAVSDSNAQKVLVKAKDKRRGELR